MNKKSKRFYISLILECILVVLAIVGLIASVMAPKNQFMGGSANLLYYTTQSNIWICLIGLMFVIVKILMIKKKQEYLKKWMYMLKLIFTVAITLTCLVYCILLAPVLPEDFEVWSFNSIIEHVVVPIIAIVDLFVDEYKLTFSKKSIALVTLPPLYYLIFAIIGYIADFKYSTGDNYPYFFLNFGSELKIFGLSKEEPYAGSFYWILLMLIVVLLMGFTYRYIFNKLNGEKKG